MLAPADIFTLDRRRVRCPTGWPLALCVGVVLVATGNDACAAALGSLVTSVGLFAALAALFAVKGWPAQLPATALSTAGGALVIAGGAAWWWRTRMVARGPGFASGRHGAASAASPSAGDRSPLAAGVLLPDGLDREALLVDLRLTFVRLQEAWDMGAIGSLRALTTTEMLEELRLGLPACSQEGGSTRTDVVTLRAELFAFEELTGAFVASVEFSGLMREAPGQCAAPFRELWMLTRSKDRDSGWKLARHQALL